MHRGSSTAAVQLNNQNRAVVISSLIFRESFARLLCAVYAEVCGCGSVSQQPPSGARCVLCSVLCGCCAVPGAVPVAAACLEPKAKLSAIVQHKQLTSFDINRAFYGNKEMFQTP